MRLKTTTWKMRNLARLQEVHRCALQFGIKHPTIVDVGPGGAADFVAPHLPHGPKGAMTLAERVRRFPLRAIDTAVRSIGYSRIVPFELDDLDAVLGDLEPEHIYVVDNDQRVLDRIPPRANRSTVCVDITREALPCTGDIVLAYHVLERTERGRAACDGFGHLLDAVRTGGILSSTIALNGALRFLQQSNRFVSFGKNIYYREG